MILYLDISGLRARLGHHMQGFTMVEIEVLIDRQLLEEQIILRDVTDGTLFDRPIDAMTIDMDLTINWLQGSIEQVRLK